VEGKSLDPKAPPKKIVAVLILWLGLALATTGPAQAARNQDGITPKQLAALSSLLQGLDGEITDFRLLTDKTVALVVSGKRGTELYVFKRIADAMWKQEWTSGTLGGEFSFGEQKWKVYYSSCGPVVFQFDGCRKYECSANWGIIIYDAVNDEVAEAQSLNGTIRYSGGAGHTSQVCAQDQLQRAIAEKRANIDSR
jgi:hypothetical protein